MPVIGDPVLLRHLVTNPVDTAARENGPGGTVWVRLTRQTLTITNTGTPVDPDRRTVSSNRSGALARTAPAPAATVWASPSSHRSHRRTRPASPPETGRRTHVSVTFTGI
jgi:hypothetical protein